MISNRDQARISAIPSWGDGDIPGSQERADSDDSHRLADIFRIFVRTWPFLKPMIFGYWRSRSRKDLSQTGNPGADWHYYHGPLLTTLIAVLGPISGFVPLGLNWQIDLLVFACFALAAMCWLLLFLSGRKFFLVVVGLLLLASAANLFAVLAVTGWHDNVYLALVTVGCLSMWLLQYRVVAGISQVRFRLGCHLVYYYALTWLSTLTGIVVAFFTIDLLNQSILQAQPITPFLADFIGKPELASGVLETLTDDARRELQWTYIIFVAVLGVLFTPLAYALPYYNVWIMQRINEELRMALVERWHQLSMRYHGDHRVGDSVYRIYQDSAQVTAIIGMVLAVVNGAIEFLVVVAFVAALDPYLGLLVLSTGIFAVGWAYWFSPRMRTRSLVARETNSNVTSRVQEVLGAMRLIKSCGTEEAEQARFEQDSVTAFNAAYRVRSLFAVITIVMFTLAAGILLGGELMMAVWASENRETFAAVLIGLVGLSFVRWNLAAFQWAYGQQAAASLQVRTLLEQWALAQDMAMGLERVFDILDIEPEITNAKNAVPMPAMQDKLRFDHVQFSYQADRPVLRDVSFSAKPGTITAIVGSTGSGKSTLAALLLRLFDPDSGRITIDGTDIRKIDLESLRDNISIGLQENLLFDMSVRDNIRYVVPEADDARVRQAAEVACVDDFVADLPDGYDTMLGDRGGRLSTGQKQRLSIARAIAKDSPVLILDEPTAALDARTEKEILRRLTEWGKGRVIFLITHRIATVRRADQILYLDDGEVAEIGTHDELIEFTNGKYRRFVDTEKGLRDSEHGEPSQ